MALGKFPHEFASCTEDEWLYLLNAWNALNSEKERK
jgi:hypothetical protein